MTRDEFLDQFLDRAGLSRGYRTPNGIRIGQFQRVAVRCAQADYEHTHYFGAKIGSVDCPGWVLEEPPQTPKYPGGEYSVTRHG